tara:strand:- start:715 stop:951 length:237 start_codon:yes stop_codon:yes gene_type:complete
MQVTLIPSYGRDYTSKAKVLADWNAGKDFTISQIGHRYDGKYINKEDAEKEGGYFNIRYKKLSLNLFFKVEKVRADKS